MTDPTTVVPPMPNTPGGPPPKSSGPLVPLLIIGGLAVVAIVVALAMVVMGGDGGGSDPGERAQQYIQAYHDNDKDKALDLIVPAQRAQIEEAGVWKECGYDRLDQTDDGADPDDPDAELEVVHVDEEGLFTNDVPGDGARQYPAVSAVVRANSDGGEFREFDVDLLEDDGQWYVRLSAQGGPASQNGQAMAPCE